MGKEQELLQAAKNGNVAQIEKILGVKSRKSGIQSLLTRTVNPNHQDEIGNTPLHHAAVNGHRSAVELLLKYDASANIPDNSGNYPLHLAAWNGHADVARVLLNTGPSRANVNEQNGTEETALHSAAQFGHSLVVAVLLENHADPYVRNSQCESPLDLAAQYGRMETVKQLLSYHPNLLDDVSVIKTHTPLHLAARNGHMNVVSYFLSCGMDVNIKCNSGTALHEASLFGKVDVVNLLLQCGIDATVVDNNNKTVIDLLASHPSARSREIRDLIYASSVKEPVSGKFNPFMLYAERSHGTFSSGKFPGPLTRAVSAIYPRDLTYNDVPEPRPFHYGTDPSGFRRSGSYNFVPGRRSRQESLNQSSYDIVPPPRDANAADLAEHLEQQPSRPHDMMTSAGEDYSMIGSVQELPPGAVPPLSADEISKGYTVLGSPANGAGPPPRCPLSIGSTYAEVRDEGGSVHHPRTAPPSADDYSRLGFPSAAEDGETVPSAGAPGRNNPGYFVIRHPIGQHSQSVKQNSETYDFVSPKSGPRPVSYQQQSVYEIPPLSQRGRGNGQEEEDKVPGASLGDHSQMFRSRSPEVYENTLIHSQRPEQHQHRRSQYDFVKAPSRKTEEPATYGNVPMPGQDVSSRLPVPTEEKCTPRYGSSPALNYYSQSDPTNHDSRASVDNSSSHGDQACPLDIPAYEFVPSRKQSDVVSSSTPEMQPFASLPGYEPMAPPENQQGKDEYEFLAPFGGSPKRPDTSGDYETLAMVGPQRPGSRPQAPAVAQQAPGFNSLPVSTPLYEVPPTLSSPVYEIAPPRQTPPRSSPVYEMAPPPRQVGPVPPPREAVMQPRDGHGRQWIEKEDTNHLPKVPSRRENPYSESPLGTKSQSQPPSRPPKPAPYEQVRLEGSSSASVDWERVRRISPRSPGGEYCTLSSAVTGPAETANRTSSGSSERSSTTEIPMTPPFSPPSPKTAEATVFEAFESFSPSEMSVIPEVPKSDLESEEGASPRPKPLPRKRGTRTSETQTSKPKVLPRSDSLHDQEFQLTLQEAPLVIRNASAGLEQRQDPFSFPPVASTSEVERLTESGSKSDFVELHKRFSPYSSREDLTVDNGERENTREEPDGAAIETAVKPSPLVYENVLFKRSDTTQGGEENGNDAKAEEWKQRPDSYRLSALSADSPMDESEEWQKIEAFLSTIGNIDVPQTLENQIAQSVNAETVPEWLKALDLGQYESAMIANGFDDIRYLNGVIEDDDLLEIGIVDFTHRRTIIEALKPLPRCPRISDPAVTKPDSVADWLESIDLPEYLEVFLHNGFTTLERVLMLWEVELTSVLEVNLLGHRKRMLASVMEQQKESESQPDKSGRIDLENSSAQLEERLAELRIYCPDEKPPPITTAAPTSTGGLMAAAKAVIAGSVKATEAKTLRNEDSARWKHNSLVLIKGSVNFSILYLGSHAVKEITGLESTIEACRKMRLSTAKLHKIPSVVLSVSVKGIKFIDGRSKIMVSYHDMKNISYITQDPTDRTVLAYIAKDSKTHQHYCHVFRAESNAVSDEVTMTIGQAFELAFHRFMQARKSNSVQ